MGPSIESTELLHMPQLQLPPQQQELLQEMTSDGPRERVPHTEPAFKHNYKKVFLTVCMDTKNNHKPHQLQRK